MRKFVMMLTEWVLWVPFIFFELEESSEDYAVEMVLIVCLAVAPIGGLASAMLVGRGLTSDPFLSWGLYAVLSVIWYLIVGIFPTLDRYRGS